MARLSTLVAAAVVVSLGLPGTSVFGQTASPRSAPDMGPVALVGKGSIRGLVLDGRGAPLDGAMVSALGATAAFALTDTAGRFTLRSLPPGPYTVRVHRDGYLPSRRQIVEVRGAAPTVLSVALQVENAEAAAPGQPVLAAGLLPGDFLVQPASTGAEGENADNHSETAWRLRHLKRSVLKSTDGTALPEKAEPVEPAAPGSFLGSTDGPMSASALYDVFPLSGQVNFITSGSFDSAADLLSPAAFASRSVAYVALGAPFGRYAEWIVRGAFTQGDMSSWFVAGTLTAHQRARHRYSAGVSYSSLHFDRSDPLAFATVAGGSRAAGLLYGRDEWTVSRRVSLAYGLTYAWYDYMPDAGLLSPRVALTVAPVSGLRLRAVFARLQAAPGAEEFLAGSTGGEGLWLPPQRTFSTFDSGPFRAETTDHFELAVERDIDSYVLGFRTFYQRVDDQAAAIFTATPTTPSLGIGHYYVASLGEVETRGWAVTVSRPLVGPVRGSVDYALTTARWRPVAEDTIVALLGPTPRRPEAERFHDVTTSVETDIAPTATRVFVVYKFNSAFARQQVDEAGHPGFDARFDVQVSQALPFLNFTSADWEVLVAVRNLFRETEPERSVFDELLVVRPPKRILGGVRVRF